LLCPEAASLLSSSCLLFFKQGLRLFLLVERQLIPPMDSYALFATWSADFDLIGIKSISFLMVLTVIAAISFPWFPGNDAWRQKVIILRPALTPVGFLFINWLRKTRHYEAQLDFACILCLAFGTAFSITAIRCSGRWSKIWSGSALFLHLQAIAAYSMEFNYSD
jgi:hypothetical protein